MITFEEALKVVLDSVKGSPHTEKVVFTDSLDRVLAQDVYSDVNMPPFNKSAMDGFACRKEDITNELEIIEVLPAGKVPERQIGPNQCIKIMTGAMIPDGANCVLMVEHTEETEDGKIRFLKESTKSNICYFAEDIKSGEFVLGEGVKIKPQHIAVLASVGCTKPEVSVKPKVAILSTGDELVEPEKYPGKSQIRNSNGYQLIAQVERAGGKSDYMGIVEDSEEATYKAIEKALENNDIVLLTGGVSMGDFDFVPDIMIQLGIDIKFQKIAVQPGKPTTFGTTENNKFVFGLPGNPVSSYTQFELLVRPLMDKMMGHRSPESMLKLEMGTDYTRKRTERKSFIPVYIDKDGKVYPVEYHGSAHIHSYVFADAMIYIEQEISKLNKGEIVDVRQI
jgi:molybdopterin molybdotransferase